MTQVKDTSALKHYNATLAGLDLDEKYAADLAARQTERYASRLARDGMAWWCEFEVEKLARHITALREAGALLPPRVGFLDEIVDHSLSRPGYVAWFERFLSEKDMDAAAVVVAAALEDIWLSGDDYSRQVPWLERGKEILKGKIAALPRATLLGYAGVMELLGEAGIARARETLAACGKAADEAQSLPLRLFQASFQAYALLWSGEFSAAEVLLTDFSALACRPGTPYLAGMFLRSSLCRFLTLRGDAAAARHLLPEDIRHLEFARLSAIPWLGVLGSQLHADAMDGDEVAAEAVGARLRKRLVPPTKHYYHAMLHMTLGVADLLLGRPSIALAHARAGRSLVDAAHCPLAQHMMVLLEVQARTDLGDNDSALALADAWMSKWRGAGLVGIASSAAVEMAVVLQRLGQPDRARAALEHARGLLPAGESLGLFHRPGDYLAQVLGLLLPPGRGAALHGERYPVVIHALGELRVRMGARLLYDRDWRGERAKCLLKALLVLGGHKVASAKLARLLWPDADDEKARGNLKVALWRLRHLGTEQGETTLPWLLMHSGSISLAKGVVGVDVLAFQQMAEAALRHRPVDRAGLLRALDLYENDFLAGDESESWIVDHRQRLRETFLAAARALADQASAREELEQAVSYLERGHILDPLDERTAQRLMACYLKLGYPGRALTFFKETEAAMARELGIPPGSALQGLAEQARKA
jgi:DNA-binding SARP family transcriptional activator